MVSSKRVIRVIPLILFIAIGIILIIDGIVFYNKPQYGKGENPENISLETYFAGDNQPTHPSAYDFGKQWNGWRYWMAYSPYPNMNGEEENPCIAVSNDLKTWETPEGLHNPIAFNEETSCDELKDPHIVYNNETDSLEMWYLGRVNGTIPSGADLLLMRKISPDGVNWSDYEILDIVNGTLSPSIIFEDGVYKCWTIKPSKPGNAGQLLYYESPNAKNWSEKTACTFDNQPNLSHIWHGAVTSDSIYRFVYVESSGDSNRVMYTESSDGLTWSKPNAIVEKGTIRHHFYRPCIFAGNDSLYCIYGTVDQNNRWGIAMTSDAINGKFEGLSNPTNKFGNFKSYYIGALKRALHSIAMLKLTVIAIFISIALGFVGVFKRLWILWLLTWLVLIVFSKALSLDTFMMCVVLLVTGLISLATALMSLGLQDSIKRCCERQ